MGYVTLPVGATDKRVTAYLLTYFESERERYGITRRSNLPDQQAARAAGMLEASSLARAIGHNDAWMSRRLAGKSGWTASDLDKISKALGVSIAELTGEVEQKAS